jgi:uncharacterized protein DUF1328
MELFALAKVYRDTKPRNGAFAIFGWALSFLIIALIAAVLGFGGIAKLSIEIAKKSRSGASISLLLLEPDSCL